MANKKGDPIRKLLADLPAALFMGNPAGTVVIMESKVVDAGADPDEVLAWVREHGGYPDKSFAVSTRRGRGPTLKPREAPKPYYVVPEDALQ
ncbi:MAG TPA: hypothetical protein VHZ31_06865 [Solirubrobacteraceae bacterium]|nr:hypothetical protein [Solirubrobacteraceae bacterium]